MINAMILIFNIVNFPFLHDELGNLHASRTANLIVYTAAENEGEVLVPIKPVKPPVIITGRHKAGTFIAVSFFMWSTFVAITLLPVIFCVKSIK